MNERQPNVVFVLTDDQGYGDLSCTGNPVVQTPGIDRFYGESVRLAQFHVGPTCAPTRAGLLTGHYANSTGVWHTIGGRSLLREDEWTLAAALGGAGYATGIFGKWHLGDCYPYRPHDRGFQTAVVHGGGGISQTPDFWGNDYFDDTYFVNGQPRPFEGYCTDVWFDLAKRFISDNRNRPFFCMIPTNAPHSPYNVEKRYSDRYIGSEPEYRARFHGMITNIDDNFSQLRDHLAALGLESNTIVIFMTDNGTSGGATTDAHGHVVEGYNAGMRGLKNSEYDGGHRTPFFLRWPSGGLAGGVDVPEVTANVDIMPTLLELCGVPVPPERSFHGASIVHLLKSAAGSTPPDPVWHERVIVTDSQRLTRPVKWRKSAVINNRWRLVNGTELFDIEADPGQRDDIAARHPEVVARLRAEYDRWWELVSTQFDRMIPMVVGAPDAPSVDLTVHDLRNDDCDVAWNQGLVRGGHQSRGYWEVRVEQAGSYAFELRRWPREQGYAITQGIGTGEANDVQFARDRIAQPDWVLYEGGRALALNQATVRFEPSDGPAPLEASGHFDGAANTARLNLELPRGEGRLSAEFSGPDGPFSAYYLTVRHATG